MRGLLFVVRSTSLALGVVVTLLTATISLPFSAVRAQGSDIGVNCLALAGSGGDNLPAGITGVPFGEIRADAVIACREAAAAATGEGQARILYTLGRALHATGDITGALEWYGKAAELGSLLAFNNLGAIYSDGAGDIAADPVRAHALFEQAARGGLALAWNTLGQMAEDGRGTSLDPAVALARYREAARLGHLSAHRSAIRLTEAGLSGSAPDFEASAMHWLALIETGDVEAMNALAERYADGRATPPLARSAEDLWSRAAAAGSRAGAAALADHLGRQPDRVAAALDAAYRELDLARAAEPMSPDGWIVHQHAAARRIHALIARGERARDPQELEALRRDFPPEGAFRQFAFQATCQSGNSTAQVYVWDWQRDYPATDPQFTWLEQVGGCVVAEDIRQVLRQLHATARTGNASFADLVYQAANGTSPEDAPRVGQSDTETGGASASTDDALLLTPAVGSVYSEFELAVRCGDETINRRYRAYRDADRLRDDFLDPYAGSAVHGAAERRNLAHMMLASALAGTRCDSVESGDLSAPELDAVERYFEEFGSPYAALRLGERARSLENASVARFENYEVVLGDECRARVGGMTEPGRRAASEQLEQLDRNLSAIPAAAIRNREPPLSRAIQGATYSVSDVLARCAYTEMSGDVLASQLRVINGVLSLNTELLGNDSPVSVSSHRDWVVRRAPWGAVAHTAYNPADQRRNVLWFSCSLRVNDISRNSQGLYTGAGDPEIRFDFHLTIGGNPRHNALVFGRELIDLTRTYGVAVRFSLYDPPVSGVSGWVPADIRNMMRMASESDTALMMTAGDNSSRERLSLAGSSAAIRQMEDHCNSILSDAR